ncbi:hypothetical protein ACFQ7Z_04550 [Streptomyces virginiae]
MTEETSPAGPCAQCKSRRNKRQAWLDWAPVAFKVMWEVTQSFWI